MTKKKCYVSESNIWDMEGYLRVFLGFDTEQLLEKRKQAGADSKNKKTRKLGKRRFSHEDLKKEFFHGAYIGDFPISEFQTKKWLLDQGLIVLVKDYTGSVKAYISPYLLRYYGEETSRKLLRSKDYGTIMMDLLKIQQDEVEVVDKVAPAIPRTRGRDIAKIELKQQMEYSVIRKDKQYRLRQLKAELKWGVGKEVVWEYETLLKKMLKIKLQRKHNWRLASFFFQTKWEHQSNRTIQRPSVGRLKEMQMQLKQLRAELKWIVGEPVVQEYETLSNELFQIKFQIKLEREDEYDKHKRKRKIK